MTDHTAPVAGSGPPGVPAQEPTTLGQTGKAQGRPIPAGRAAISGIVAAGAALATGELLAGFVPGVPSPIAAVGTVVIDLAPPGGKDLMVSLFGTNDKVALTLIIAAVVLAVGAAIGLVARRSRSTAAWVIVALVGVGGLAALLDPTATDPLVVLVAALQIAVGYGVLTLLLTTAQPATQTAAPGTSGASVPAQSPERRAFLLQAGAIGVLSLIGGAIGRSILSGRAAATANAAFGGSGSGSEAAAVIPPAVSPAPTPGPDASLNVPGITPVVMPNDQFYRIDTAFFPPSVDLSSWNLHVFGMVDKEVRLTFEELVQLPLIERYVTIACVSNEVGGNLVGNAKWTGAKLADVLAMAGVKAGATQVVPRSIDGWTAGFPTSWITDPAHPRDAIIAVKMNDAPLPVEHGFPARLIVPGLYGYVSATKWLTELELTTLEAIDAYWVPRGWAKEAPILTQSRIDVPQNGAQVPAGPTAVAGIAWAPDRGISKVEVRIDGGAWHTATLATELTPATWVQWKWTWQAAAGQHVIEVRATDGTGAVQTAQVTPPDPDGARGHHQIAVEVR
jgi:DMSO/TMAO reductase YedYZ molybdopterin-dependent catalytic subunit